MNKINVFLQADGSIALIEKDFTVYQGLFQNIELYCYVPTSIIVEFNTDEDTLTTVKMGCTYLLRSGKQYVSPSYYMYYFDTETINDIEYRVYKGTMPSEFTKNAGYNSSAVQLVFNVVNITPVEGANNETTYTVNDVITTQTVALDVMPSAELNTDEVLEPSQYDILSAEINETEATLNSHIDNRNNPHEVTAAQVGLGDVDNTSDLNKPISTATQNAIDDLSADLQSLETEVDGKISATEKGVANGVASLDQNGKVPTDQLYPTGGGGGGSSIVLNGESVDTAVFYAPTESGTAGQTLKSNGAGQAPTWVDEGVVYTYKGSVPTFSALPTENLSAGDVYNVEDTGNNYAWTGTEWDGLGASVDLSAYLTKTEAASTYVAKETGKGLSTNDYTTAEKDKLAGIETGATKVDTYLKDASVNEAGDTLTITKQDDSTVTFSGGGSIGGVTDVKVYTNGTAETIVSNGVAQTAGKPDYVDTTAIGEIFNSYSGSNKNVASGSYSHAEGYNTTASGSSSHAEGYSTTASGISSHAEGYNTTASKDYSHAEGNSTKASGGYSHAEGNSTTASGISSHAEGNSTKASGASSHAEGGGGTTASGISSHAEGYNTTAIGSYSHAEGFKTTASKDYSHAEGGSTKASGASSHAQNSGTIAAKEAQTALGKYNVEDTDTSTAYGKYAVIIGNGTSATARSNALAVTWTGEVDTAIGKVMQTPTAWSSGTLGTTGLEKEKLYEILYANCIFILDTSNTNAYALGAKYIPTATENKLTQYVAYGYSLSSSTSFTIYNATTQETATGTFYFREIGTGGTIPS